LKIREKFKNGVMKIILTGATGMVGKGVLLECLEHPQVEEVLSISRSAAGLSHSKLKEYLISDFMNIAIDDVTLQGYDACFFCAGVSSIGMDEKSYSSVTYDMTLHFANVVLYLNPNIVFDYVSGAHTDSSEKSKVMWARVKGKTENSLKKLPFKQQYNFRPGLMKPTKGQIHLKGYNKYVKLMYPIMRLFFPACSLHEIGLAMINSVLKGYPKNVLEVNDIKKLSSF
jgi:hypothetical protein